MKILVLGDIHFKFKNNYRESNKNIGNIAFKVLENDVFKYAHKNGIKHIIHMGDFTDKAIPSEDTRTMIIRGFKHLYKKYPDIVFHSLIGNHDINRVLRYKQPYPNCALNTFDLSLENLHILSLTHGYSPFKIDDQAYIYALPYFTYETDFIECLQDCVSNVNQYPNDKHILLFHQDLKEVIYSSTISAYASEFNKFDLVINGHLHNYKKFNSKFILPGSFIINSVNDIKSTHPKGILVIDTDKPTAVFKEHSTPHPTFIDVPFNEPIPNEHVGQFIRRYKPASQISLSSDIDLSNTTQEGLVTSFFQSKKYNNNVQEVFQKLLKELELTTINAKEVQFNKIHIEGFRTIVKPITIDYNTSTTSLTYVIGDVASGKSSALIEALVWVLFGKIQRDPKNTGGGVRNIIPYEHIQPRSFKGTRIQLEFTFQGYDYLIARHLKYKKKTLSIMGGDKLLVFKKPAHVSTFTPEHLYDLSNDVSIEQYPFLESMKSKARTMKQLEILLGVSYEVFVNSIIFDLSKSNLINASSGELSDILEKLFHASWIDDLKILADVKRKALDKDLEKTEYELQQCDKDIQHNKQLLELCENNINSFNTNKYKRLRELQSSIDIYEKDIEIYKNEIEQLDLAIRLLHIEPKIDLQHLQNKIQIVVEIISKIEKFIVKQKNIAKIESVKELQEAEDKVYNYQIDKLTHKINILTSELKSIENVSELGEKRWKLSEDKRKISNTFIGYESSVSELKNLRELLKTRINEVRVLESGKCSKCQQTLKSNIKLLSIVNKDIKHIGEEITELKSFISNFNIETKRSQISKLQSEIDKIQNKIEEVKNDEEYNASIRKKITKVEERKKEIAEAYNSDKDTRNKEIFEYQVQINTIDYNIENPEKTLKLEKEKLEGLKKKLEDLDEYNKAIDDRIKSKTIKEEAIKELKHKLGVTTTLLSVARSELEKVQASELEPDEAIRLVDLKLDQKTYQDNYNLLLNTQKHIYKNIDTYKTISSDICSKKGLKSYIIKHRLVKLNKYAIDYAKYSNIMFQIEVDPSSRYKLIIYKDGHSSPACNLSGGESTTANMMLICSLHDTVQETLGIPLMLLDEPFNHIRETNSDMIHDVLDIKAKKGTKMYVITHLESLSGGYNKLLFSKNKHRTMLEFS